MKRLLVYTGSLNCNKGPSPEKLSLCCSWYQLNSLVVINCNRALEVGLQQAADWLVSSLQTLLFRVALIDWRFGGGIYNLQSISATPKIRVCEDETTDWYAWTREITTVIIPVLHPLQILDVDILDLSLTEAGLFFFFFQDLSFHWYFY